MSVHSRQCFYNIFIRSYVKKMLFEHIICVSHLKFFKMSARIYNNISSNETDILRHTQSGNFILLAITIAQIIVSILCLLYLIFKLTLNKFIKVIFCIMAIQNLVAGTVMTIANTGYSLSEALILASINPKYDNRMLVELQVQYSLINMRQLQSLFN